MIKVGIIRTRSVTIALLSYARSAAAAARSISGPAPDFRILLGLAGNGRAHRTCGEPRLPPRLTPFDRRSGDTLAVLRACRGRFRNSGWSCFRCRSLASFHTRCTACTRSLLAASAARFEAICCAFHESVVVQRSEEPPASAARSHASLQLRCELEGPTCPPTAVLPLLQNYEAQPDANLRSSLLTPKWCNNRRRGTFSRGSLMFGGSYLRGPSRVVGFPLVGFGVKVASGSSGSTMAISSPGSRSEPRDGRR